MSEAGGSSIPSEDTISPIMEGEKKSSGGSLEDEEDSSLETTMVMTCEGNISDPMLQSRLESIMSRLQKISNSGRSLNLVDVQPWNSVKVKFTIPREAARRLYVLAQAGEPALRHLGILSVQVEGDQVVSLKLTGSNNETNEVVFRQSDNPHSTLMGSAIVDRLTGALGGTIPPNHQQQMHQMPSHIAQTGGNLPINYRSQASSFGQQSQQLGSHHGTSMMVRSANPPGTLIHHRPSFNTISAAPPPYPAEHPQLPQGYVIPSGSKEVVSQQSQTYRLASVPAGAVHQSGGRQVIVRQSTPQMLVHTGLPSSQSTTIVNNAKNSPLLVGLLQQPEQSSKQLSNSSIVSQTSASNNCNPLEVVGVATSQLTSMAANHYSNNVHRQQVVTSSNQYSSTTRSKDGLTTHQQVFSGGSVITNARVPVPGGLQQHPQATGKPPPTQSNVQIGMMLHQNVSGTANPLRQSPNSQQQVKQASSIIPSQVNASQQGGTSTTIHSSTGTTPIISSISSSHPASISVSSFSTTAISSFSTSHVNALTPPLTPSNNQSGSSSISAISQSNGFNSVSCVSASDSISTQSASSNSIMATTTSNASVKYTSSGSKFCGGEENQYLINPNTGLLEPRPNTDSSDSESDLRTCSPIPISDTNVITSLPSQLSQSKTLSSLLLQQDTLKSNKQDSISTKSSDTYLTKKSGTLVTKKSCSPPGNILVANQNKALLAKQSDALSEKLPDAYSDKQTTSLQLSKEISIKQHSLINKNLDAVTERPEYKIDSFSEKLKDIPHENKQSNLVNQQSEKQFLPFPVKQRDSLTEDQHNSITENVPMTVHEEKSSVQSRTGDKQVDSLPSESVPLIDNKVIDPITRLTDVPATEQQNEIPTELQSEITSKQNKIPSQISSEIHSQQHNEIPPHKTKEIPLLQPNSIPNKPNSISSSESNAISINHNNAISSMQMKEISSQQQSASLIKQTDADVTGKSTENSDYVRPPVSITENSSNFKQKEDLGSWEKVVTAPIGGLKVKLKLPKDQKPFTSMNSFKKLETKEEPLSDENPVDPAEKIPKLHIKFESNAPVIVKPDDAKDIANRKIIDKFKDDKRRKNTRKRCKTVDSDNEILDNYKSKSNLQSVSIYNDMKKVRLSLDDDDRNKSSRNSEDQKYLNKVDNVTMAKYEAKLRIRPKMKQSMRHGNEISNSAELTSHKIMDTLPPSITRVAALHTQQPHRNPTPSSSNSFFSNDLNDSSKVEQDLYSDIKEEALSCPSDKPKSLLNGLKSRVMTQQNTFSELTAAGKLTIKRGNSELRSSMSVLKKETHDGKRKLNFSNTPAYLNSSVYINKVSSGGMTNSSYSRLHDSDRGRLHQSQTSSASAVSVSSGSKGGKATPFCPSKYLSLNSNSNITIQSVRKKDILPSAASRLAREDPIRHIMNSKQGMHLTVESVSNSAKSGKVTCIDVTDRKAVEEAVKSSRNSNNNVGNSSGSVLDSQKCGGKQFDLWNNKSTSSSSSSISPSVSSMSNDISHRLTPESTNLNSALAKSVSISLPSSVNVSKECKSQEKTISCVNVVKTPSSNDKNRNIYYSSAGNLKSLVNSSNLVDKNNCDNRINVDTSDVSSCSDNSLQQRNVQKPSPAVINIEAGNKPTNTTCDKSAVSSSVTTINKNNPEVSESPDGTPKGEHGNGGQGGEDSGIESMDALSEKSPNQNDQSPSHRREEKDCENYNSGTNVEKSAVQSAMCLESVTSLNVDGNEVEKGDQCDTKPNVLLETAEPENNKTETGNDNTVENSETRPESSLVELSMKEEDNTDQPVPTNESETHTSVEKDDNSENQKVSKELDIQVSLQSSVHNKNEIVHEISPQNSGFSTKKFSPVSNQSSFTVVNPSTSGSSAMILLPSPNGASSTIGNANSAKVVTLKSSSFSTSSNPTLTPVGKAFRLVSLPDNMSVSPSSSPVKGQLVTFKQLVPSSSSRSTVPITSSAVKTSDSPPSLLKAQLLAPLSTSSGPSDSSSATTNGESENNLDFVGFASSKVRMQTGVTKLSQVITPEKDSEKGELMMSPITEDDPTPLRVQPPLYTYGSNKEKKKEFEGEQEENASKEKTAIETAGNSIKLVTNDPITEAKDVVTSAENKAKLSNLLNTNKGFEVLTIEIPSSNAMENSTDDKRLTRTTRQSVRLASPRITSSEISPRQSTSERKSPVISSISNVISTTASLSMSSIASNVVSVSGRVLANSGSITVTSLTPSIKGQSSPATRGSNKRRRPDSDVDIQQNVKRRMIKGTSHEVLSTNDGELDSSSEEDSEVSNLSGGVVVVGVASCLAQVNSSPIKLHSKKTANPSPQYNKKEEEVEPSRPSSRSSRAIVQQVRPDLPATSNSSTNQISVNSKPNTPVRKTATVKSHTASKVTPEFNNAEHSNFQENEVTEMSNIRETRATAHKTGVSSLSTSGSLAQHSLSVSAKVNTGATNRNNNNINKEIDISTSSILAESITTSVDSSNRRKTRSTASASEDLPNKRRRISKDK